MPLAFNCPVPSVVPAFRKVTVPVGVLLPDCVTVAVRVMACPVFPEVGEAVRVVELAGSEEPGH
jgi:hypothetical protein